MVYFSLFQQCLQQHQWLLLLLQGIKIRLKLDCVGWLRAAGLSVLTRWRQSYYDVLVSHAAIHLPTYYPRSMNAAYDQLTAGRPSFPGTFASPFSYCDTLQLRGYILVLETYKCLLLQHETAVYIFCNPKMHVAGARSYCYQTLYQIIVVLSVTKVRGQVYNTRNSSQDENART